MKKESFAGKLLNELRFTNREVAEFTGLKEIGIKQIRGGRRGGNKNSHEKIIAFVKEKIRRVNKLLLENEIE